MIKAVIFDMDGVIADSGPIHKMSEQQALFNFGAKFSIKELQQYTGATDNVLFTEMIKKYNINTTFKDILKKT